MVAVPVHGEDGQRVRFVGLELLSGVALGALVDVAFLGAYQEHVFDIGVEVEAEAAGEAAEHALLLLFGLDLVQLAVDASNPVQLLFVVHLVLFLALRDLQCHDLLALQLVSD